MGGDPKGGRVCWPTAAIAPPTAFQQSAWIPAAQWRPAQSPYTAPAPNDDIWLPTSGNAHRAIKFIQAADTMSTVGLPFPMKVNGNLATIYLYWLTDTASTNNVKWRIGHRVSADAIDMDVAITVDVTKTVANAGQYFLNRENFNFVSNGSAVAALNWATALLTREGSDAADTLTEDIWALGCLYVFEGDLT